MDYKMHYDRLINRAIHRAKPEVYTERHHVVPKCLGGSDNKENIVRLTPEEHIVAHELLVKIYPGNFQLLSAIIFMTVDGNKLNRRPNNKLFGWVKREFSKAQSGEKNHMYGKIGALNHFYGRTHSAETRRKISENIPTNTGANNNFFGCTHTPELRARLSELAKARCGINSPLYGKKLSEETKAKISASHIGKIIPAEVRLKMSASNTGDKNGFFGKKHSEETKAKLSAIAKTRTGEKNPNFGRKLSPEHKAKVSAYAKTRTFSPETRAKISAATTARHARDKLKKESS